MLASLRELKLAGGTGPGDVMGRRNGACGRPRSQLKSSSLQRCSAWLTPTRLLLCLQSNTVVTVVLADITSMKFSASSNGPGIPETPTQICCANGRPIIWAIVKRYGTRGIASHIWYRGYEGKGTGVKDKLLRGGEARSAKGAKSREPSQPSISSRDGSLAPSCTKQ